MVRKNQAGHRDVGPGSGYLDLELTSDLAKLTNPQSLFDGHRGKLVILDEAQRIPSLFATLRGVIDRQKRAGHERGQFLFG